MDKQKHRYRLYSETESFKVYMWTVLERGHTLPAAPVVKMARFGLNGASTPATLSGNLE